MTIESKTQIKKCPYLGWYAETAFPIKGNTFFIVSTCKRYSGVSSSGRVYEVSEGMRSTMIGGGDITTHKNHAVKRATEKAINEEHNEYVQSLEVTEAVKNLIANA